MTRELGPIGHALLQKLEEAFRPEKIELRDESHKHVGHAGARPDGESHFHLEMCAGAFTGKSRIERQRMVHRVLSEALQERVHALSLRLSAPGEN